MSLAQEILSLKSYKAINDIIPGKKLHDLQCVDILKVLHGKRSLLAYPTGTGKTLMAGAIMELLLREDSKRKFIVVIKNGQLIQTPFDIEDYTRREIIVASGDSKQLEKEFFNKNPLDYDILMCTTHAFLNKRFTDFLFENLDEYTGVIIDEAHFTSNHQHADVAAILKGLCTHMEYVVGLTATPVTTDFIQLARLLHIIDPDVCPDINKFKYLLTYRKISIEDYPFTIINRDADEFGRVTPPKGLLVPINPMAHQVDSTASGHQMFQVNRGWNADRQIQTMHNFIAHQASQGKRGLVFINQHEVRAALLDKFDGSYKYECINSETKKADRFRIMDEFNVQKSLDVAFISVKESLNLDCDYVFFYELTVDVKQVIGRAHRGLDDKLLMVYFMLTMTQKEIDYFINNIYAISKEIQEILGKDYSEITSVKQQIEEEG